MLLAHPGGNLGDRMHTWQDIVSLYFLFFKMPNLITLNLEYEDSNRNQINETVHKKILCPETRVEAFRPAAFLLVPSFAEEGPCGQTWIEPPLEKKLLRPRTTSWEYLRSINWQTEFAFQMQPILN